MLWGQRLVRAEQDDGEWVKWDDHTMAVADMQARAERAEAQLAIAVASLVDAHCGPAAHAVQGAKP